MFAARAPVPMRSRSQATDCTGASSARPVQCLVSIRARTVASPAGGHAAPYGTQDPGCEPFDRHKKLAVTCDSRLSTPGGDRAEDLTTGSLCVDHEPPGDCLRCVG